MRIASIGECMVEFAPDGAGHWRLGFAGDTFNTLWSLRALLPDAEVDYVSAFGDDRFSGDQRAFFDQHGIGIAASPIIPGGRPGLYAIHLDGHERSFTYWRSDSVARRLADDRQALFECCRGRDLLYFSGITLAILDSAARANLFEALTSARAAGSRIAFDPNYRPRLWPDRAAAMAALNAAYGLSDIVLPTFDDENALFGDRDPAATLQRLQVAGIREAVVKNGPAPALLLVHEAFEEVPAAAVVRPVDTSGAGDAFNGAYLAARLKGRAPAVAATFAHRIAAAAIGTRGALAPLDTLRAAARELAG
jgi:2-dehydro-3-deoxygluconokinase